MRKFVINGMNIGYVAPNRGIDVSYDNTTSGLLATDVQTAIDELGGIVDNKVDKETGKGLFSGSYNDLTDKPSLATVATSGSYNDLSNKPSIPTAVAVKGNAESSYRTGNVNLTPANIGALSINTSAGIAECAGNGKYSWCRIATIKISSAYINRPILFELSGRGTAFTNLMVMFASANNTDPALQWFYFDGSNRFYIKKVATSTWEVYYNYTEVWGQLALHRISGNGADIGVTVNMDNVSSAPSGVTQATPYITAANSLYADNSGKVNNLTVQTAVPANAKFTDTVPDKLKRALLTQRTGTGTDTGLSIACNYSCLLLELTYYGSAFATSLIFNTSSGEQRVSGFVDSASNYVWAKVFITSGKITKLQLQNTNTSIVVDGQTRLNVYILSVST